MRTIQIIIACLGLSLAAISCFEVARIRQYRLVVSQVRSEALRMYQHELDTLRERYRHNVLTAPSMETVLSGLDGVGNLENGWWVVSGIGAVCCFCAVLSFALGERQRRRGAANNMLETTAG